MHPLEVSPVLYNSGFPASGRTSGYVCYALLPSSISSNKCYFNQYLVEPECPFYWSIMNGSPGALQWSKLTALSLCIYCLWCQRIWKKLCEEKSITGAFRAHTGTMAHHALRDARFPWALLPWVVFFLQLHSQTAHAGVCTSPTAHRTAESISVCTWPALVAPREHY